MPRRDGTGPMGMGRMTRRGAGRCAGYATPDYANPTEFAGGFGCGFGRGRGFGRMLHATGMPGRARNRNGYYAYAGANRGTADERSFLNNQAELLEKQLQQIKKRLSHLKEDDE